MAASLRYTRQDLLAFTPRHDSFVGIDSDGCVFDTMEIKQKQCFHPAIVAHWHLEPLETLLRETAEFTNLYSVTRGQNRFLTLVKTFDLLRARPEAQAAGVAIPPLPDLRRFIASGAPLANATLEAAAGETGSRELASVLAWSTDVNERIAATVQATPPFPWALKSLRKIHPRSDAICVSQTPSEALVREWSQNGIASYVAVLAGQELGTKSAHIAMATKGRYASERVLMIGDAPGDRKAALDNGALFYPINPAHEDASWERFHAEAYDRFLAGRYAGDYAQRRAAEFEALLPATPPWEK
jgi:phosphoglycolate phosphatase-like HAD superfamily hydrolase